MLLRKPNQENIENDQIIEVIFIDFCTGNQITSRNKEFLWLISNTLCGLMISQRFTEEIKAGKEHRVLLR